MSGTLRSYAESLTVPHAVPRYRHDPCTFAGGRLKPFRFARAPLVAAGHPLGAPAFRSGHFIPFKDCLLLRPCKNYQIDQLEIDLIAAVCSGRLDGRSL